MCYHDTKVNIRNVVCSEKLKHYFSKSERLDLMVKFTLSLMQYYVNRTLHNNHDETTKRELYFSFVVQNNSDLP